MNRGKISAFAFANLSLHVCCKWLSEEAPSAAKHEDLILVSEPCASARVI